MASYQQWLQDQDYGAIQRQESLSGGCINAVTRLFLDCGRQLIIKENTAAPSDMFAAEAAGLAALAEAGACRVPAVIYQSHNFILLEDLGSGRACSGFWELLGQQLAVLHSQHQAQFGFVTNNYCGATAQNNSLEPDGHRFFAEYRLMALARQACNLGVLSASELSQTEFIATNLERWIPVMPASLIHGDLWSGNVHVDEEGQPALIDPATYWGWAEAELAMTGLFGGFPQQFYSSYANAGNLDSAWRERSSLYNLYHLLNHLLLFGGSYRNSVQQILRRFGK